MRINVMLAALTLEFLFLFGTLRIRSICGAHLNLQLVDKDSMPCQRVWE